MHRNSVVKLPVGNQIKDGRKRFALYDGPVVSGFSDARRDVETTRVVWPSGIAAGQTRLPFEVPSATCISCTASASTRDRRVSIAQRIPPAAVRNRTREARVSLDGFMDDDPPGRRTAVRLPTAPNKRFARFRSADGVTIIIVAAEFENASARCATVAPTLFSMCVTNRWPISKAVSGLRHQFSTTDPGRRKANTAGSTPQSLQTFSAILMCTRRGAGPFRTASTLSYHRCCSDSAIPGPTATGKLNAEIMPTSQRVPPFQHAMARRSEAITRCNCRTSLCKVADVDHLLPSPSLRRIFASKKPESSSFQIPRHCHCAHAHYRFGAGSSRQV